MVIIVAFLVHFIAIGTQVCKTLSSTSTSPPPQLGLAVLLVTSARQAAPPSYTSEPGAGPSSTAPPSTGGSHVAGPSKRLLLASWAPSQAWLAALSPSVSLLLSPVTVAFCRWNKVVAILSLFIS